LIYSLKVFARYPRVREIVVAVNKGNAEGIRKLIRIYRIKKIAALVLGGKERQDSVGNCLKALDKRDGLVLIHDAARPFIDEGIISRVIAAAEKSGAAVPGMPVKNTIKEVYLIPKHNTLSVKRTIKRDNLWEIQTPQAFRHDLIRKAYARFADLAVTDEAMLIERMGKKVTVVEGGAYNIKITTPQDLIIAQSLCRRFERQPI